jgi:hypothetical protein
MDRDDPRTGWYGKLPIFATEFGVSSTGSGTELTDNYGWDRRMQPTGARAAFAEGLDALWDDYPRVTQLYWYRATDGAVDNRVNNNREWFFGLFDVGGLAKGPLPGYFTSVNDEGGYHG